VNGWSGERRREQRRAASMPGTCKQHHIRDVDMSKGRLLLGSWLATRSLVVVGTSTPRPSTAQETPRFEGHLGRTFLRFHPPSYFSFLQRLHPQHPENIEIRYVNGKLSGTVTRRRLDNHTRAEHTPPGSFGRAPERYDAVIRSVRRSRKG